MILKRLFDFITALIGLIIISPLLILVSILIKCASPGPVFYLQNRVGQEGKLFKIIKFRTMFVNADKSGLLITPKNDPRITTIGKYLRNTKIDELPQLINIIKGDISFVGPRPEVLKYVELYKKDYEEILKIKPGITDYAAIEFRNEEHFLGENSNFEDIYFTEILPKKINLYKKYISERNFWVDLKLIYLTLLKIFKIN